jgi:hypothetical protein
MQVEKKRLVVVFGVNTPVSLAQKEVWENRWYSE